MLQVPFRLDKSVQQSNEQKCKLAQPSGVQQTVECADDYAPRLQFRQSRYDLSLSSLQPVQLADYEGGSWVECFYYSLKDDLLPW